MLQRIKRLLLHLANSNPPSCNRREFYDLKTALLWRFGQKCGLDIQEIKKECWGERYYDRYGDEHYHPCGPKCRRCGGTGIFDIRWVILARWQWGGYIFH